MNEVMVHYTNKNYETQSIKVKVGDVVANKSGKQFVVISAHEGAYTAHGHIDAAICLGDAKKNDGTVISKVTKRQFASRFLNVVKW